MLSQNSCKEFIQSKSARIIATIEARMGSSRLPGKVLKPFHQTNVLDFMVRRVRHSSLVDDIVVATSVNSRDGEIAKFSVNALRSAVSEAAKQMFWTEFIQPRRVLMQLLWVEQPATAL